MSFLSKLFGEKDKPIRSYSDFWDWFKTKEKRFHKVIQKHHNIEKGFFDVLSPKLDEIKPNIFFLTGMMDDDTAELVLTPDGNLKNVVFVEELIAAAPKIKGWEFTGMKPALDIADVGIGMGDYEFKSDNMFFYSNELSNYPDEINITIVHKSYNEENKGIVSNGCFIFLDNYLGELNFISMIDEVDFASIDAAKKDLIPIEKLKSFLKWREKEFIEKYEGLRYDTDNDTYRILEMKKENGQIAIAVINQDILNWESKASHPWLVIVKVKFEATNESGFPDEATLADLDNLENELLLELKDKDGFLNIGRQTADKERHIYFACKDFRKPSKVLYQYYLKRPDTLDFDIYKDKYWQSFERFNV